MRIAKAPAKINLALHVTGQRDDGYHLIDSIVVFADKVAASDSIIVSHCPKDGFDISGPLGEALSLSDENLVLRARDLVRRSALAQGIGAPGVHISLEKRLPVASGIGGGSADAAAAIKVLHEHWGVAYHADYCGPQILAKALGADVPMCLMGAPLRASGIGENLTHLENVPALHMVLVNCGKAVSTPQIFAALEEKANPPLIDLPDSDFVSWLKTRTRNDLLGAALSQCEPILETLKALESAGAHYAQMSGSGATCFGLFGTAREAAAAAAAIQQAQPNWWVVATRTGASKKELANESH